MTRERWAALAPKIFLAGAIAWLIKLIVIAAEGSDSVIGVFFLAGLALLLVGSTGIGARLALTRSRGVFIAALIASPIVFWFTFTALDPVGRSLRADAGPAWLKGEEGILLTAVLAAIGAFVLLSRRPAT